MVYGQHSSKKQQFIWEKSFLFDILQHWNRLAGLFKVNIPLTEAKV